MSLADKKSAMDECTSIRPSFYENRRREKGREISRELEGALSTE
jgi:hypothetical protein